MKADISRVLDDCIKAIDNGQTVESCLAKYPEQRLQLEPLLKIARDIASLPKVAPSDEYKRVSKARLMARIAGSSRLNTMQKTSGKPIFSEIVVSLFRPSNALLRHVTVPITIILLITLISNLIFGSTPFSSETALAASQSTLRILSGSVEIQKPGFDRRQQGIDGMTLPVGTLVKTGQDSYASITFYEGSTITLEPETSIELAQIEYTQQHTTTIVLKQLIGRTWSRVVKMIDSGWRYKIETPAAAAVVRGTLFSTEVKDTGFTTVATTEGLVGVEAQGEEVYVQANQKTEVDSGTSPATPIEMPEPRSEIIITIAGPVAGSLTDPSGASTGIFANGMQFNQITASQSSSSGNSQVITLTGPKAGSYTVTLRGLSTGIASFSIQGKSDGKNVFYHTGTWNAKSEDGRLVHCNVNMSNGEIIDGSITSEEPLENKMPEKIVRTKPGTEYSTNSNNSLNTKGNGGTNIIGITSGGSYGKDINKRSGNSNNSAGNDDSKSVGTNSATGKANSGPGSNNGASDAGGGNKNSSGVNATSGDKNKGADTSAGGNKGSGGSGSSGSDKGGGNAGGDKGSGGGGDSGGDKGGGNAGGDKGSGGGGNSGGDKGGGAGGDKGSGGGGNSGGDKGGDAGGDKGSSGGGNSGGDKGGGAGGDKGSGGGGDSSGDKGGGNAGGDKGSGGGGDSSGDKGGGNAGGDKGSGGGGDSSGDKGGSKK